MEPTHTDDFHSLNTWAAKRIPHHSAVAEAAKTAESVSQISRATGLTIPVVRSCLDDLGIDAPNGSRSHSKSETTRAKALAFRQSLYQAVQRLYDEGLAVLPMAQALGTSRTTINRCLHEIGIERPDFSEGNRRSAAKASPNARRLRASAAHLAVASRGELPSTRIVNSIREQRSARYVGKGEQAVVDFLLSRGVECIPQCAFNGYNVDIMIGDVAVEIHNFTGHPTQSTRGLCRIVNFLRSGKHVLYVMIRDADIVDAALEHILTFCDFASRNPTARREYRVIWGNGKRNRSAERKLDEIANILILHGISQT